jgi:hypothetical protein
VGNQPIGKISRLHGEMILDENGETSQNFAI